MVLYGISGGSLLIIFLIAIVLFGFKRLRAMVKDLGVALQNFSKTLRSKQAISPSKESKSEILDDDPY
ncbi:MAG: twin-arginine translocase TatA/TatE family subunit [Rickettsiella sp.]|nr:twin-arginine translocase TatA/TatE family subunit [Rickettsiella sp.]